MTILLLIMSGTTVVFAAENGERTPSGIAYSELEKQIEDYIASILYGDAAL